jgi:TsgA-like MFS transporter
MNPTAVASAGRMTSVTSMGIMLPAASSGAILMPWVIGRVAERAGLAAGMAMNIVPCVGLIIFSILVERLSEQESEKS